MEASGKAQIQLELAPLPVADLLLVRGRSGDVRSTSEVLDLIRAAAPAAVAEARAGGARRYCFAVGGFGSVLHANRSG